ncbi:hypothetical protein CDO73_01650 [Saccharibacillus sp. O23]|uniref:DUF4303 domain-containing protein n=1 Tax=Saccharibacillus sp. O23 TaxID=2009338 RepID=UPI000B4E7486|nr:DUF4303 domain-containing protein [Saccharibacillus sp. O23]OWR32339.1 hypothetical protein CDO73_01650 [Saccharibacillus sp. O23]
MKDFFAKFTEELVQAVRADFAELVKRIGNEKLYAVALVTDSDAGTVYLGMNTEESLGRRVEYYKREGDPDAESYISSYRWMPDEWAYSDGDLEPSQTVRASRMLSSRDDYSEETQAAFCEAASEALKQLDQEGLFSNVADRDELTLFVYMNDDDRSEDIEDYSAKLLNPEPVYLRFKARYDSIGE